MSFGVVHSLRPHCPPPVRRRRRRRRGRSAAVAAAPADGAAVVWFKNDLRLDDHPGLTAAAAARRAAVLPLYVFDARILAGYSDTMLKHLLSALDGLKLALQSQKSDLLIRTGVSERVLRDIVNEVSASVLYAEDEVVSNVRSVVVDVELSLSALRCCELVRWTAPLYNMKDIELVPTTYDEFVKEKYSINSPLAAPELPPLSCEIGRGLLPTLEEVKQLMRDHKTLPEESWESLKYLPAKTIIKKKLNSQAVPKNDSSALYNSTRTDKKESSLRVSASRRTSVQSMFESEAATEIFGGTAVAIDALAAYLRYLESTGNKTWQEVHEKVRATEEKSGASFYALFGITLCLGIISRRRVYFEAIKYEKERNAGFISPFGYSAPTVAAGVEAISSMEWYWLLSLKSQQLDEGFYPIKIWRWQGHLLQYTAVGHEGPAVLLVHGFGAFFEHFRDNIQSMANLGCRVWAITLIGFGKSEKPNVKYTELMWSELLRDFIIDVVREPAHLVGNSIGGYIAAIVAGLWPKTAKSLSLLNSAGYIVPKYSSFPLMGGQLSWFSWLQARLILLYLRSAVRGIVKTYYPAKPERVDAMLINHMIRASHDPGASAVLEDIFSLNLSIPLNFLFDSFEKKVCVIQGMRDPLTKSASFVAMLREHCSTVVIKEMDAGHCPHDELPEAVNSLLWDWICSTEVAQMAAEK